MNIRKKEDIIFVLLFTCLVCWVFVDILLLRVGFLKGDYLQQLYPWSKLYSEGIKNFHLSLWISAVHSGFPLFAEGQIGQLYPLNILMFFFLPFRIAYNYSFLVHFILSGIFTYMLARKKGSDLFGGALSAVLVVFGSGYAGCFIHLSALRCLTWFPLVLLLYDVHLEKGKRGPMILLVGLIVGMQLVSGSIQMAMYSVFFSLVYFFYGTRQYERSFWSFVKDTFIVLLISVLIAAPQIVETMTLTGLSNRKSLMDIGFSMWNSLNPIAFSGLVMPYMANLFAKGNMIYIGTVGLFFALISITTLKRKDPLKSMVWILVFSIFLALGKYNPLYVLMVRVSGFYSFRAPARAIYFAFFSLSILAGAGFTHFFSRRDKVPDLSYRLFRGILLASVGGFLLVKGVFSVFGPNILEYAKNYVSKNIYGQPFHRYDLDSYIARTEGFYTSVRNSLSFDNNYVVWTILLILAAAAFIYLLKRIEKPNVLLKFSVFAFVCFELWFFSLFGRGIRPELDIFRALEPAEKNILQALREDNEIFRICPFGDFNKTPLWLRPSMNALYNMDSVAIYSPLVNRDYFLAMKGLGTVDDSLGIFSPREEILSEKLDTLRKLNVKYVVSTEPLELDALSILLEDEGIYLYQLKGYLPRFWFSGDINGEPDGVGSIDTVSYGFGHAELDIESRLGGYLIFSEKNYPGWTALVDGIHVEIASSQELIQSVWLGTGRHKVVFRYYPKHFNFLLSVSLMVFLSILGITVWKRREY